MHGEKVLVRTYLKMRETWIWYYEPKSKRQSIVETNRRFG